MNFLERQIVGKIPRRRISRIKVIFFVVDSRVVLKKNFIWRRIFPRRLVDVL